MAAWPHFVPRIEFDRDLKALTDRLDGVCRRLGKHEEDASQLEASHGELRDRCREELVTFVDLSAAEERIGGSVVALAGDVRSEIAGLRTSHATEADLSQLRELHGSQLEELGRCCNMSQQDLALLRASLQEATDLAATHATSTELSDVSARLQSDCAAISAEMWAALNMVDRNKATTMEVQSGRVALEARLDEMVAAITELAGHRDGLLRDMAVVQGHCSEKLATKASLDVVINRITDVSQQADAAAAEGRRIEGDLGAERETLKQLRHYQQDTFKELRRSIDRIRRADEARADLHERVDQQDQALVALNQREREHWEAWMQDNEMQRKKQRELVVLCESIQKDLELHATSQREDGERLRHQCTAQFLDQMDKAIDLHNSVQRIEKVQGVITPRVLPAIRAPG